MLILENSSTATASMILTSQSSRSIHLISALPASRSMTCFVMSTTSRSNLEIWEIERLVGALSEVRRRFGKKDKANLMKQEYIDPQVAVSPQDAFYADKESLPLRETEGRVCSEFVMCYPPGIPILAPGERITGPILDYIEYAKEKGCSMTGPEDPDILRLNVLKGV